MNKLIKRFTYIISLSVALGVTACSDDIASEITELNTDRVFSPTGLTAKIVNQTSVRLTWNAVGKANSYQIEILQGETVIKTVDGVTTTDIPYTISGLEGETEYTAQVKAIAADIADSKYSSATFKTDPEQIFKAVAAEDLKATEATLRWTAGEAATEIVLTPGNIKRAVTAAEIAAGAATITGLVSETLYTAKLMKDTKTRGTATFTTLIDLGGAIKVEPTDDLATLIASANNGDVFALMPGTYAVTSLLVEKSIAIKGARPTNRPILSGTIIRITKGAGLELKDLILDGLSPSGGDQAIIYDEDGTYGKFAMDACVIKNYTKGTMYVSKMSLIESMSITNCIYSNIECNGGDFIDFRNGIAKTFTYKYNTAYNSAAARDFFRMDDGGSTNFPTVTSIITIENNTFYNVSNNATKRLLYIRLKGMNETHFNKNLLVGTAGYYSNQSNTKIVEMANNNYFNAPNFTASTTANAINDKGVYTLLDPGFKDADKGDFTVSNETVKDNRIGDPRWLK